MNPLKDQYDSLYASGVIFGEGKPIEAVTKLHTYLQGGMVLDVGGGDGRNALHLAEQGFVVTVTDISEVGLEKVSSTAKGKGLDITTIVRDVVNDGIDGMYDAIISSFVFHHIEEESVQKIVALMQEHTKTNGVHVIATFANSGGLFERNITSGRFYPSEAVLRKLYASWNIEELESKETLTLAHDKEGRRMKNVALSLVARKP